MLAVLLACSWIPRQMACQLLDQLVTRIPASCRTNSFLESSPVKDTTGTGRRSGHILIYSRAAHQPEAAVPPLPAPGRRQLPQLGQHSVQTWNYPPDIVCFLQRRKRVAKDNFCHALKIRKIRQFESFRNQVNQSCKIYNNLEFPGWIRW